MRSVPASVGGPWHIALLGPANSIHFQRWAQALVGRGLRVTVISQHRDGALEMPAAAELHWLPFRGMAGYFLNAVPLRRLLRKLRPHLLHAHYASGYGTTMGLSGYTPTLLSVWGSDVYDFPYEGAFKGGLLRRNLRRADAIASTSHAMARQTRSLVPLRREIAVTPFGIDTGIFQPDPVRGAGSRPPSETVTIGTVKTLAPKYGIDVLLRAFARLVSSPELKRRSLSCRLVLVGGGPQQRELESLAQTLGVRAGVEFVGQVPHEQVPAWLNRFDIYVAASRSESESFGVAAVEASSCGIPVVVSDAGGLPEVVVHGETGFVVPREDVEALCVALHELVLKPGLRDSLGRAGRERVAREYEWTHCVDLMLACYASLIEEHRRRP